MKEHHIAPAPESADFQTSGILFAHGRELEQWLDSKAAQGWRLVGVTEDRFGVRTFYFERELPYP